MKKFAGTHADSGSKCVVIESMDTLPNELVTFGAAALATYSGGSFLLSRLPSDNIALDPRSEVRYLLSSAMRTPCHFEKFAQGLVPQGEPPPDILKAIAAAVRRVLGGRAYIQLVGSATKRKHFGESDHDYHIRVPDGWFASAQPVTPYADAADRRVPGWWGNRCQNGLLGSHRPTTSTVTLVDRLTSHHSMATSHHSETSWVGARSYQPGSKPGTGTTCVGRTPLVS